MDENADYKAQSGQHEFVLKSMSECMRVFYNNFHKTADLFTLKILVMEGLKLFVTYGEKSKAAASESHHVNLLDVLALKDDNAVSVLLARILHPMGKSVIFAKKANPNPKPKPKIQPKRKAGPPKAAGGSTNSLSDPKPEQLTASIEVDGESREKTVRGRLD